METADQLSDDDEDVLPSLQTVTHFDDGSGNSVQPTGDANDFHFQEVSHSRPGVVSTSLVRPEVTRLAGGEETGILLEGNFSSPTSFLIESLVTQLCKFMEKDGLKQRDLYNAICRIFYDMKLIDGTYAIEELDFMRNQYLKAVWNLLQFATIANEPKPIRVTKRDRKNNILSQKHLYPNKLLELSRYQAEFVELEYIAHGGFGRVYKARNKLDGGEYAVKKICLRYQNVEAFLKDLQEVRMLAQLNHPNIVAYKAAWLEPLQSGSGLSCGNSITDDSLSRPVYEGSDRMSATDVCSPHKTSDVSRDSETRAGASLQNSPVSSSTDSSEEKALCVPSHLEEITSRKLKHLLPLERDCATLYIQMQLCDQTLLQWLNDRNSRMVPLDIKQCLTAFRHLVCGVEYIHSKGIVHHDIKPSNIFVNGDLTQVQVGDFGLACFLQHSHNDVTLLSQPPPHGDHKNMEIGTKLYAAPEQLEGVCDQKSDLYSLGIVLLELLQPCYTVMEKSIRIKELKDGIVSEDLCALAPDLVETMIGLTSCSVDKRPTSSELLVHLDYLSSHSASEGSSVIKHILSEISQRDKEIEELKHQISQRDKEIEDLKHEKQQSIKEIAELKLRLDRYESPNT